MRPLIPGIIVGAPRFLIMLASAALYLMRMASANAQDWQASYDASGNFAMRTAASGIAVPQILSQPQLQVVAPGELASFSVVMADARGLTYQWRFNGTPLSGTGSTSDTLLLANVSAANEGPYSVVVANSSGSVTSAPAMLMLDSDCDGLPDSWEQNYFGNLTSQRSLGDADRDGNSNLDEFRDDTNPTNKASARFRLTVLSDGGLGLVDVDPFRLSYTNGELVTLTAFPFPPNTFRRWTGDTTSTNASISLVMTTNKTVFAHMMPLVLTWTNVASGDWHVASNWSPNLVPASNDNVSITRHVTVSVNAAAECGSLIFGDAASAPILTGTGTLVLFKDCLWTAGTMSGAGRTIIAEGASLNIANPDRVYLTTRTLENGGTVVWSGAGLFNFGTAVMTNRPGALFHALNDAQFIFNGGSSRIDNAGTFRKSGSGGTTTVGNTITFNNYNLVEILSGTLLLGEGGVNSGTFDLGTGTTLNLSAGLSPGIFSSTADSIIAGAGNLTVSGGTADLAGLVNLEGHHLFSGGTANLTGNYICTNNTMTVSGGIANFSGTGPVTPSVVDLSSGILGGSGLVTVASQMIWTGGTMSGSGRTIIAPNATLNINNPLPAYLTVRMLENGGTILWTGANIGLSTTVITNRAGAQFNAQNAVFLFAQSGNSRFDNAGTFRKSANTGTTTFADGVSFNNYGIVEIRSGILAANGGYTSTANALLNSALGGTTAGAGYGQLQVAGAVTLNGALSVDLINGFVPAINDSFTVLTAGTRNATFANFYYPSNTVTMQLSNTPNSVLVRVTGIAAFVQPVMLTPDILGTDLKLTWTSVSNVTYRVEYNSDLNFLDASNWTALPGDVPGISNTATKLDALTTSNRFYRVRVVP